MFTGEGSEKINVIAEAIERLRRKKIIEHGPNHKSNIVVYVGHKQYADLMCIDAGDLNGIKDKTFLGAKIVKVCEDSYLHAVTR